MFILTTDSLPASCCPISSSAGAIILQGAHHSAQKSTRTAPLCASTSASKLASVTVCVDIPVLSSKLGHKTRCRPDTPSRRAPGRAGTAQHIHESATWGRTSDLQQPGCSTTIRQPSLLRSQETRMSRRAGWLFAAAVILPGLAVADEPQRLTIKDHHFAPQRLEVPAGVKFSL